MSKREFLSWYNWLHSRILSAIDNVVATPLNNEQFIWAIEHNQSSPGPDSEHPYPSINNSSYAAVLRGAVAFTALFGIIFAIIINFYKKNRRNEATSNYFFFGRLFHLIGKNELETFLGRSSMPYDYLRAVAYFYNPDVSPVILWIRRAWAFICYEKNFYNLKKYLRGEKKRLKKTEQVLIEEIYKEINEKLVLFINKKKNYGEWYTEKEEGKWFIRPSETYIKAWQTQKHIQIEGDFINLGRRDLSLSFVSFINYLNNLVRSIKDKKKFCLSYVKFIEHRLKDLGDASFVYWIFVFLFYFIPGYCVIGAVVWPPILIAGIFLGAVWLTKIYKSYKEAQIKYQLTVDNAKEEGKRRIEAFLTHAIKCQIKIEALLSQKTEEGAFRYAKVKFREQVAANSNYKESRLCKEIREVIRKKSDFRGVRAIFNGFILGCFTIYFSFWLLSSALALVVSLNSVIVSLVTLVLGISYGIYSAVKYYKQDLEVLSQAENDFAKLERNYANIEVPDISLRAYDRLFRRAIIHPSRWTVTKQVFKRLWIGFIKFGTGMLFLKLLPLGTTSAIMTAIGLSVTGCSFFPMLGVMITGGVFFAAWHIWQYHCESKEAQAGRIMDFLLNTPSNLQDGPVCSETMENVNNNSLPCPERRRVFVSIFNKNERDIRSMFNGSNRFLKLRRQSSNSEPCLSEQRGFTDAISLSESNRVWQANNSSIANPIAGEFRKRSNTSPPDIRVRKHSISQALLFSRSIHCNHHVSNESLVESAAILSQSGLCV
jgi:hypothetical protein